MSYDIVVFDPTHAPRDGDALRAWLDDDVRSQPASPLIARAVELLQQFSRPFSEAPDELVPGEHFAITRRTVPSSRGTTPTTSPRSCTVSRPSTRGVSGTSASPTA